MTTQRERAAEEYARSRGAEHGEFHVADIELAFKAGWDAAVHAGEASKVSKYMAEAEALAKDVEELRQQLALAQSDASVKHKCRADCLEMRVEKLIAENAEIREGRDNAYEVLGFAAKYVCPGTTDSAEAVVKLVHELKRDNEKLLHAREWITDSMRNRSRQLEEENADLREIVEAAKVVRAAQRESGRYSDRMTNALRGLYDQLDELTKTSEAGESSDYRREGN